MTIEETLTEIKKHIDIINSEMGVVDVRLAVLETKIDSLLWMNQLILGTVVVAVIGAVLTLVLRKKNGK